MNNPEGIKALVAEMRVHADPDLDASRLGRLAQSWADRLESLTAVAGDAEVVARELLAQEVAAMPRTYEACDYQDEYKAAALRAIRRALNTRQAVEGMVPGELRVIGELIRTQDNRITDSPIFIVQQKRIIAGVDADYGGELVWVDNDSHEVTDPTEAAELEAYWAEHCVEPDGYTRTGKAEIWEFVTACFTEQGCKDYLARDGHNLKEPRIYAAGSYRNEEFRAVRKFLMSLAAAPADAGEVDRG